MKHPYKNHVVKHGHGARGRLRSRVYNTWSAMIQRCANPNAPHYYRYGGRGIRVCRRWRKFENFLADMGLPPEGMSLDRINNNLGYFLSNCRWASRSTQARNTRTNRWLTHNGQRKLLIEWAEEFGLRYSTLSRRLLRSWPIDVALVEPSKRNRRIVKRRAR